MLVAQQKRCLFVHLQGVLITQPAGYLWTFCALYKYTRCIWRYIYIYVSHIILKMRVLITYNHIYVSCSYLFLFSSLFLYTSPTTACFGFFWSLCWGGFGSVLLLTLLQLLRFFGRYIGSWPTSAWTWWPASVTSSCALQACTANICQMSNLSDQNKSWPALSSLLFVMYLPTLHYASTIFIYLLTILYQTLSDYVTMSAKKNFIKKIQNAYICVHFCHIL